MLDLMKAMHVSLIWFFAKKYIYEQTMKLWNTEYESGHIKY